MVAEVVPNHRLAVVAEHHCQAAHRLLVGFLVAEEGSRSHSYWAPSCIERADWLADSKSGENSI